MDISKMSLWGLKQRYAKSNGKDQEAGNELQRRGLNSKQLREILWEHGQQGWHQMGNPSLVSSGLSEGVIGIQAVSFRIFKTM